MNIFEVHVIAWHLRGVHYTIRQVGSGGIFQHGALVNQELSDDIVKARFPKLSSSEVSRLPSCFRKVALTETSDTISIPGWDEGEL